MKRQLTPFQRFTLVLAGIAVLLALIPALVAVGSVEPGGRYLGTQTAVDDAMVYSAWMHQAADGSFLLDNRFTTDVQPGLTIQVYFWVLGLAAKVVGIPTVLVASRVIFGLLFVVLLGRVLARSGMPERTARWALGLSVFGGGVGFMVWETFGQVAVGSPLGPLLGPFLPTDVWQTEMYAFPSLMVNGLFPASLCLILLIYQSVLDARDSWKPVLPGAVSMLLLMNMHSYDVLLIALVLVGFLVQRMGVKDITGIWVARAVCIGLGAIPSALWFMRVLQSDEVFQARAETLTYAAGPKQMLFGLLPLIVMAGLLVATKWKQDAPLAKAGLGAGALVALLALAGWSHNPDHYFLGAPAWLLAFVAACSALFFVRVRSPFWGLVCAWALVGFVAPYFPGLFQRKLAMGLAIPWALLAAKGLTDMLGESCNDRRRVYSALAGAVACASSAVWLLRDVQFAQTNVSSTTLHPVKIDAGANEILKKIEAEPGRKVVLALPGLPARGDNNEAILSAPLIPDLNPMASGLSGAYTYAGHWSETPDYANRRNEATMVFLRSTSEGERMALIEKINPDFIIAPKAEGEWSQVLADLTGLGESSESGPWVLIDRRRR